MYFLVIKTGSKERRKGTQNGERNEQGNNPETLIGSVFQGMLKGFVLMFFDGGFSAFFGRFGFRFLFSRLWQFFLRPFPFSTLAGQVEFYFWWWFCDFFLFFFTPLFRFIFFAFGGLFLRPLFLFCACTASVFYWCGFRYRRTNPTLIFAPFFLLLPQSGMIFFFAPFSRLRRELFCFYAPFAFFTLAQQT
jgi:hypothetical protein